MSNEEFVKIKANIQTIRFQSKFVDKLGQHQYIFTIRKDFIKDKRVLAKLSQRFRGMKNPHLIVILVKSSDIIEQKQNIEILLSEKNISNIKYSSQYCNYMVDATKIIPIEEVTTDGFSDFISTNYKGIGKVLANKILNFLLDEKVEEANLLNMFKAMILSDNPALKKVMGKKFDNVKNQISILETKKEDSVTLNEQEKMFCSNNRITYNFLLRLKKQLIASHNRRNKTQLKDLSILKHLKKTPYLLAIDDQIRGFAFKSIDQKVFQFMGKDFQQDPSFKLQRFLGYLQYILVESESSGHLFLSYEQIHEKFIEYNHKESNKDLHFFIDDDLFYFKERIKFYIDTLKTEEATLNPYYFDNDLVSTMNNFFLEKRIAKYLVKIQKVPLEPIGNKAKDILEKLEKSKGINLSDEQKEAVFNAINNRVSIITGGPGTGKTTISQMVVGILSELGKTIKILAPTGTASKRISTVIEREAMTIHRGLEFKGRFLKNEDNPLSEDVIIIDESSMIDSRLASSLLSASINSQIIFIGDVNQLPSVGAGDYLRDIIESGAFNVSNLTKIFRQAEGNPIIQFAYKVNRGEDLTNFYEWFSTKEDMHSKMSILTKNIYKSMIDGEKNEDANLNMIEDTQKIAFRQYILNKDLMATQVLVANNRSNNAVNKYLQEELNGEEEFIPDTFLKVKDKVIQTKNNYTLNIFNGTIGIIKHYDKFSDSLTIEAGDDIIEMDRSTAKKEMQLCYSMTIHKSQGQEFKYVIMLLNDFILNNREIIYTGATRAKEHLKIVSNTFYLRMGLQTSNKRGFKNFRNTRLINFIHQECDKEKLHYTLIREKGVA